MLEEEAPEREGGGNAAANGAAAPAADAGSAGGGPVAPAGSAAGGARGAGPALTEAERLQFVYRCQLQLRLPDEAGARWLACHKSGLARRACSMDTRWQPLMTLLPLTLLTLVDPALSAPRICKA